MEHLGIPLRVRSLPALDPGYIPPLLWHRAFLTGASRPLGLAVEREGGSVTVVRTLLRTDADSGRANRFFAERLAKTLLWTAGGFRLFVSGDRETFGQLADAYRPGGARAFDADFMAGVYGRPFEVVRCGELPQARTAPVRLGGHYEGCRIGFDAGGSVRKVCAVIDGETVFTAETPWDPKNAGDPDYHREGISASLRAAAAHLPRVDAVGVSSAGIFVENSARVSSLFLGVPAPLFAARGRDVYLRAAAALGDVPLAVCNDGDVSALAGAAALGGGVLGLSLGTSEGAGFVDAAGRLTGRLSELAFVPADYSEAGERDPWSGDTGTGVGYLSQDGAVKLAARAGLDLSGLRTPQEKFARLRGLLDAGSAAAAGVFRDLGVYLGHALAWYREFYDFRHALLLGGVLSGPGGALAVREARRVLAEDYPEEAALFDLRLPDENTRRVGQAFAAAGLPELRGNTKGENI